jgi:hypothetical protein
MFSAYRVGRFFARLESRAVTLEENVNKAMTNDLPHIQVAITETLRTVVALRDDIRDFILKTLASNSK